VFLGLTMGCARCHDHKFDPLRPEDYYRLRAFLATILPDESLKRASPAELAAHDEALEAWREASAEIRAELAAIEERHYRPQIEKSIVRFPEDFQPILRSAYDQLPSLERQLHNLGYWQVYKEAGSVDDAVKGTDAERRKQLLAELKKLDGLRPPPLAEVMAVVDVGPVAPPTFIPGRKALGDIAPGFLTVLDPAPARIDPVPGNPRTSGRRAALARWLTRPDNQLSTRVVANRVWQHLYGRGLVETSNDFGTQGARPTNPELLDWLARELVGRGSSFKALERLILASRTYQQAAAAGAPQDTDGDLLWRERTRRLTAEEMRDAMLAASGELERRVGGPAADDSEPVRSLYVKFLRNQRMAMMAAFDGPDGFTSCARRITTTTAPQALLLLNGEWTLARARAMARRIEALAGAEDPRRRIELAYGLAFSRLPSDVEAESAARFLARQARLIAGSSPGPTAEAEAASEALADLCHTLFNANEFLYVD
jgi:hypothetical protein